MKSEQSSLDLVQHDRKQIPWALVVSKLAVKVPAQAKIKLYGQMRHHFPIDVYR
jgi:hypothetical protein